MNIVKIECTGCGATLNETKTSGFVTCEFCGSKMEVSESTASSQARGVNETALLRMNQELENLIRDWNLQSQSLLLKGKNGSSEPTVSKAILTAVLMIGFAVFIYNKSGMMDRGGIASFIPPFLILFGVLSAVYTFNKARKYQTAKAEYEAKRGKIEAEIAELKNNM